MGVKTIFKALIGTTVLIVLSSLIIELINISANSSNIRSLVNLSLRQSCIYFSQETYKIGKGNGISLYDEHGNELISAFYYPQGTEEEIYRKLYSTVDFRAYASNYSGKSEELNKLAFGLNSKHNLGASIPPISSANAEVGIRYVTNMVTPINLGKVYLDRETLENIFKYNIAMVLGGSNNANIRYILDDLGNIRYYTNFKGYRIYYKEASITNINYKVLDLEDTTDQRDFKHITGMDADYYINYLRDIDSSIKEDKYFTVASIEYSVPIQYEGISPLKNIMKYIFNNAGIHTGTANTEDNLSTDRVHDLTYQNKINYYIVR